MKKVLILLCVFVIGAVASAGSVSVATDAPAIDILVSGGIGGSNYTRIFDPDANANHGRGNMFFTPAGGDLTMESLVIRKNAAQTFVNDTLTLWVFEGTVAQWDLGDGDNDGDMFDLTGITNILVNGETFTINGSFAGGDYVTLTLDSAITLSGGGNYGFMLKYDQGTSSNTYFQLYQDNSGDTAVDGAQLQAIATYNNSPDTPLTYYVMGPSSIATVPVPGNGETNVAVTDTLSWTAPGAYTGATYDVYFGTTEPNFNDLAPYGLTQVATGISTTTATPSPSPMDYSTPYYWVVDSYEPNTVPILHQGSAWSFTTVAQEPSIVTQPVNATIQPGDTDADLTIEGSVTDVYTWYKVGTPGAVFTDGTLGTPLASSTYTVNAEGYYYCVVSNDVSLVTIQSDTVRVMTPRLVVHWDFEGDLVDTEVGYTGTYVDPNDGTTDTETYTGVSDPNNLHGQAFIFDGGQWGLSHVQIGGDANDFNFYTAGYTVSAWIKTTQAGYGAYVSKQALDKSAGFLLTHYSGTAIAGLRPKGSLTEPADVNNDQWHMVTGVYDPINEEVRLFVDGLQIDSMAWTGTPPTNDQPLLLGAELTDGSTGYRGLLDEVHIWNYVRTNEQIGQDYLSLSDDEYVCDSQGTADLTYDFDDNCIVDLADFAEIANAWLNSNRIYPAP